MQGFRITARITRKFPTVAMNAMSAEQEAVEKDKYVGAVVLSHGYFSRRDIFFFPPIVGSHDDLKKRAAKFQNTKF